MNQNQTKGFLIVASFLIAFLSWKFVEIPFRNKKVTSTKTVFLGSVFFIIAFSIIGYMGHKTNGFFEYRLETIDDNFKPFVINREYELNNTRKIWKEFLNSSGKPKSLPLPSL